VSKSIAIKIYVLANAEGKWAAYGWTDGTARSADEVLYDMMSNADPDSAKAYLVTAEIPLPEPEKIIGVVGSVEKFSGDSGEFSKAGSQPIDGR